MDKRNFNLSLILLVIILFACNPKSTEGDEPNTNETKMADISANIRISQTKTAEIKITTTATSSAESPIATPSFEKFIISEVDGMKMVYVSAGEFLMGSNSPFPENEQPQQLVYLDGFWIDQTEVTNAMYLLCIDAGECEEPNVVGSQLNESAYSNHPVEFISWNSAVKYCNWAGKRLPTEAEWEKAARGTDGRIYPWGDTPADQNLTNYGNLGNPTKEVGSYPQGASPYGALDLAGNVSEWVYDWYGKYSSAEKIVNPKGPESGDYHLDRGGSRASEAHQLRTSFRASTIFDNGASGIGFRCLVSESIQD